MVRRRLTGEVLFSRRLRPRTDQDCLQSSGRHTVVLEIQGVVFFGNADDLAQEIRRVMDIDASGIAILRRVADRFRAARIRASLAVRAPTDDIAVF